MTTFSPSRARPVPPGKAGKRLSERIARLASPECKMDRALKPRAIEFGFGATLFSLFKPMLHTKERLLRRQSERSLAIPQPQGMLGRLAIAFCGTRRIDPSTIPSTGTWILSRTLQGPRLVMANSPEMTPEKAAKLTVERQEKYAKIRHPAPCFARRSGRHGSMRTV